LVIYLSLKSPTDLFEEAYVLILILKSNLNNGRRLMWQRKQVFKLNSV